MVVTFCGHRKLKYHLTIKNLLYMHIENLIKNGADTFLVGCYGEFDLLAANIIHVLKNKYPEIKSVNIIPYTNKKINEELFDKYEYPLSENANPRYAIIEANKYMVDKSDVVIAHIKRNSGGAFKTFCYAKYKQKDIILI